MKDFLFGRFRISRDLQICAGFVETFGDIDAHLPHWNSNCDRSHCGVALIVFGDIIPATSSASHAATRRCAKAARRSRAKRGLVPQRREL